MTPPNTHETSREYIVDEQYGYMLHRLARTYERRKGAA